jgi:NDP-sugar pyrophosphorylase family protein
VHPLRLLRSYGARRVVVLVDHLGEQFAELLGDGSALGLELTFVFDSPGFTGTAGSVRGALEQLGDEFLVMYGDTYLRIDYRAVLDAHRASGMPALMTVLRNAGRWGESNADYAAGVVTRHDKHAPDAAMEWIDYGLGVLTPAALQRAPRSGDLADVYGALAAEGRLAGYVATERFFEIGSPEALAETEAFLLGRR